MSVEFSQKWVGQAVQKLFGRSALEPTDLEEIKYLTIGESFENDFFIEMSVEQPPKPFVNTDGGDEWAFCLRGSDISELVKTYKDDSGFQLSMFELEREDKKWQRYCFSGTAEKLWSAFSESVLEERYYEEHSDEEFDEWYDGVRASIWRDIALFAGVEVLRIHGLEIPDLMFLKKFTNLRTAEFVETTFNSANGIERLNVLEQLACWRD